MDHLPSGFQSERPGFAEFDRDHEAEAPHFPDKFVLLCQLPEPVQKVCSCGSAVFDESFFPDHLKGYQTADSGKIVLSEGRRVDHAAVHRTEYLFVYSPGIKDRPDRAVSA